MCLRKQLRTTLIMLPAYHGDRARSRDVQRLGRERDHLRYAPTLARTSARKKRSMNSMNSTDGTMRIRAVIEATW